MAYVLMENWGSDGYVCVCVCVCVCVYVWLINVYFITRWLGRQWWLKKILKL